MRLPSATLTYRGPVNSTYLVNRQRNRCSHRDYQNIGVNGARAQSMDDIMKTLARNQVAVCFMLPTGLCVVWL